MGYPARRGSDFGFWSWPVDELGFLHCAFLLGQGWFQAVWSFLVAVWRCPDGFSTWVRGSVKENLTKWRCDISPPNWTETPRLSWCERTFKIPSLMYVCSDCVRKAVSRAGVFNRFWCRGHHSEDTESCLTYTTVAGFSSLQTNLWWCQLRIETIRPGSACSVFSDHRGADNHRLKTPELEKPHTDTEGTCPKMPA